jgi:hypothetical protein
MYYFQRWTNFTSRRSVNSAPWWGIAISGILFNISWFAIISSHSSLWAPIIVAAHLLLHGALIGTVPGEGRFILGVGIAGLLLDQILFLVGVFVGPAEFLPAPFWLSCLWPVMATAIIHAFRPLQSRLFFAALVGCLGGAVSYSAGVALTPVDWTSGLWGPLIIALAWSIIFPLLLFVARRQLLEQRAV